MFKYDLLVYIGRFQPFHLGHESVVRQALKLSKHVLIILGSADSPRTPKNPFSDEERATMIYSCFQSQAKRVKVASLADYPYDEMMWSHNIGVIIKTLYSKAKNVGIVGFKKDASSYYLDMFNYVEVAPFYLNGKILSSTSIRDGMFCETPSSPFGYLDMSAMNKNVFAFCHRFQGTEIYRGLQKEYIVTRDYKKQFSGLKYPIQFITVDIVVEQCGHVLLVKRRGYPGKGLCALPGGFKDHKETCAQSAIRELMEETGLNDKRISDQIESQEPKIFDHPDRSSRGTTVTMAYHVKLSDNVLHGIKAGDDAEKAQWFNIASIRDMRDKMFEDHWHIINHFVKMEKNDD